MRAPDARKIDHLLSDAWVWAEKDPFDPYKRLLLEQALDRTTEDSLIELALEMQRNP
jgi:hypothetical protein